MWPKTSSHLAGCVEELVDESLAAVEEYRVDVRVEFVAHQLLDVLLNLRPELLVVAHQQLQQLTYEPAHEPAITFNKLSLPETVTASDLLPKLPSGERSSCLALCVFFFFFPGMHH